MRSEILLCGSGHTTEAALYWAIAGRPIHLETCQSVDEALVSLERSSVDILICDDEKLGMAWLDLLIGTARRHTSVVSIVTAHRPSAEIMIRAVNEGRLFAFLPKPIDRDVLRYSVDEALRRSATHFALRHALVPMRHTLAPTGQPPMTLYRPPVHVGAGPDAAPESPRFDQLLTGLPGDLSLREWEVLALLTDGLTTRQIAKRLFISVYTVRNHLKSMYRKLEVHSQSELIDWHQSTHPHVATG
jgi:DNA-binding NarL/FixJ family response regulator